MVICLVQTGRCSCVALSGQLNMWAAGDIAPGLRTMSPTKRSNDATQSPEWCFNVCTFLYAATLLFFLYKSIDLVRFRSTIISWISVHGRSGCKLSRQPTIPIKMIRPGRYLWLQEPFFWWNLGTSTAVFVETIKGILSQNIIFSWS